LKYTVEVRGAAERDVAEAMDWYEAQAGLGAAFLDDFAQVLARLSETPLLYQVVYRESRRAQLRRFPYLVWFKVQGPLVTVRACLRGSINPAKVRRRLR
jgi:plasmid stabilization system protein ParE